MYQLGSQSAIGGGAGGSTSGNRGVAGNRGVTPRALTVPKVGGADEIGSGIFRITDSRPLDRVAELLERKFGVPVSYEEELLQYSGDMVFAADLPGNRATVAKFPEWKGPLVPRLGVVELTVPPREILEKISDPTKYIQEAIDSHQGNHNPGGFKVLNLGAYGFSIVMNAVADKLGQFKPLEAPLDVLVSFPEKDRSLGETLELVSKAVAAAGRTPFGIGTPGSESYFETTQVRIGAQNEPARNVIAKALRAPGQNMRSWNLHTLPGGFFILGVRAVEVEVVDEIGNTKLKSLTWPR